MSSMLLLAFEFADDFEGGILANANCGGMFIEEIMVDIDLIIDIKIKCFMVKS